MKSLYVFLKESIDCNLTDMSEYFNWVYLDGTKTWESTSAEEFEEKAKDGKKISNTCSGTFLYNSLKNNRHMHLSDIGTGNDERKFFDLLKNYSGEVRYDAYKDIDSIRIYRIKFLD